MSQNGYVQQGEAVLDELSALVATDTLPVPARLEFESHGVFGVFVPFLESDRDPSRSGILRGARSIVTPISAHYTDSRATVPYAPVVVKTWFY